jgi:hypothetical protein
MSSAFMRFGFEAKLKERLSKNSFLNDTGLGASQTDIKVHVSPLIRAYFKITIICNTLYI